MPRTAFGRSYRIVASLLLLVSLLGAPHRQQDDDACLPVSADEHDASKHAFAPLAPVEHDHCAVCHWMRGLKPSFAAAATTVSPFDRTHDLPASTDLMHRAPCGAQLPARAPPAIA